MEISRMGDVSMVSLENSRWFFDNRRAESEDSSGKKRDFRAEQIRKLNSKSEFRIILF